MYSCRQRDIIFCLQETGSLSLKLRRKPIANYLMSPMDASPVTIAGNGDKFFILNTKYFIIIFLLLLKILQLTHICGMNIEYKVKLSDCPKILKFLVWLFVRLLKKIVVCIELKCICWFFTPECNSFFIHISLYFTVAILLSMGKVMFFELEKIMNASNDISFYLGRRDNHKISLSNIFPAFNDVIANNKYTILNNFFY